MAGEIDVGKTPEPRKNTMISMLSRCGFKMDGEDQIAYLGGNGCISRYL